MYSFTNTKKTQQQTNLLKTAPHSPRRQKLNLRMKSLSLDSPESTELHSHIKRRYPPSGPVHFNIQGGSAGLLDHNTPPSNNSRLHCKQKIFVVPLFCRFHEEKGYGRIRFIPYL